MVGKRKKISVLRSFLYTRYTRFDEITCIIYLNNTYKRKKKTSKIIVEETCWNFYEGIFIIIFFRINYKYNIGRKKISKNDLYAVYYNVFDNKFNGLYKTRKAFSTDYE